MSAALHIERVRGWLIDKGWKDLPEEWLEYEDMGDVVAITNIPQGDPVWQFLRCGLITTSVLTQVMTPKKRDYSAGARGLLARLIGERLLGEPYDWGNTGWTDRGHDVEDEARQWYALERGVTVRQVGFLLAKDGEEGGSPDGLVGDDGGVEIKCYGLDHHMRVLLGTDPFPENESQVQGLMRLTNRKWWDCVAYHPSPKIPNRLERVQRDETYIEQLDLCVTRAKQELARAMERMEGVGTARIDSTIANFLEVRALSEKEKGQLAADIATAQALGILPQENAGRLLAWLVEERWQEVHAAWDVLKVQIKEAS